MPPELDLNVLAKENLSLYDDEALTLTTTRFMPGMYQTRIPVGNGYVLFPSFTCSCTSSEWRSCHIVCTSSPVYCFIIPCPFELVDFRKIGAYQSVGTLELPLLPPGRFMKRM
jgi:hypothetical protein